MFPGLVVNDSLVWVVPKKTNLSLLQRLLLFCWSPLFYVGYWI